MQWTLTQKIIFRFLACYFFLFCMSNQFVLSFAFEAMWQAIVPWFAKNVLHLEKPITVFTNGSGDTTYNFLCLLMYVLVALMATAIWSMVDRRRTGYDRALYLLIVVIKYYVVFQMVIYGLAKLFYMQFQPPRFSRLIQPYGDSSPMGLLWTFMGYSKGYTMFTGFGELAGGILLIFRKTRTLGALVVLGVMANVMALNFFYDVPVKILSTHLVLMAMFLIALDFRRVWNVFIANKPTEPVELPPFFKNPRWEKAKNIAKWVVVIIGFGAGIYSTVSLMKKYGPEANRPVLYGLYETDTFERNSMEVPPMLTDSTRWRWLIVEGRSFATVMAMDGKKTGYTFLPDTSTQTVIFKSMADTNLVDTLHYAFPDTAHFQLEGILQKDTLKIVFKTKKKEDFLLINRGYRWVNETPFNR